MLKHCGLVMALIVGMVATAAPRVWGQGSCVAIEGIGQASYPPGVQLHDGDIWGGPAYFTLGGQEFLTGNFSGQDGTDVWNGVSGLMGKGKGGTYTFSFGPNDSFTTHATNAVFPNPPGKSGFGYYQASQKIVSGTGRFQFASGDVVVQGTYVIFAWAGGTAFEGRWNPSISGKICNVAPPSPQ